MKKRMDKILGYFVLVVASFCLLPGHANAVDGVKLITQARALAGNVTPGDAPGFPVTISLKGSYRLASNLTITSPSLNAVDITSQNVFLDLNGFTINGPGSGSGVGINGKSIDDIIIVNGTIRQMGSHGIDIDSSCRVENVRSIDNGGDGIRATSGSIVSNNTVGNNTGNGIRMGLTSVVIGNTVNVNGQDGIVEGFPLAAPRGSIVSGNTVGRNGGFGLNLGLNSGYSNNTIIENNGGNANPQVSGGIEIGTNICGTNIVCP